MPATHTQSSAARFRIFKAKRQRAGGKGNIRLIDGPEGPAVCLREPESDFETRIYLYENALRTEFSRVTAEIDPNNAEKLCDLKTFKAELSESGLLTITADGMTAGAYCDGGGAA